MFNIWAPATLATFNSAPRNRLLVGGVGVGRSGGDIFWKVFKKGRLRSIEHAIKFSIGICHILGKKSTWKMRCRESKKQ
jgi:hypothetical protein